MDNMELYNRFRAVPAEAQKLIAGGRLKGMTDINPMWRIKTLTEEFGACGLGWKYSKPELQFVPGANGEISVFASLDLYIKIGDAWSDPIPGIGGAMFTAKEKSGMYTDDEAPKKAVTDALSVACKSLGIGADVYFEKDSTKYQAAAKNTTERIITALDREQIIGDIYQACGGAAKAEATAQIRFKKPLGQLDDQQLLEIAQKLGIA